VARLFGRGKGRDEAPVEGPGSQTGRAPSGIIITSGLEDWVPSDVAEPPAPAEGAASPTVSDWVPPGMPEPTSQAAGSERRRSTVNQVPPELRDALPPDTAPVTPPTAERELKKTLADVRRELEQTREETVRLHARLHKLEGAGAVAGTAQPADEGEEPEPTTTAGQRDVRVNLNTASVDDLMALPGLGRRAAERIVAHRETRGPFTSVSGLLAVEGFHHDRIRRFGDRAVV
jgi:competence protein ComEA